MPYKVRWPDAEYHEVLPRLFVGGHQWAENVLQARDSRHSSIAADASWDYIVSAYVSDWEASWPRCDHRLVRFGDTEDGLDDETWEKIGLAVDRVVIRWVAGEKVLIRCQSGYNRSGMIAALVLMRLGLTAEEAIRLLRETRGPDVLINPVFEEYVREREKSYREPNALPMTKALVGDRLSLLK